MILVTEDYEPADQERAAEIRQCREANARWFLRHERMAGSPRLRFGDVFRRCAEQYAGQLCVLANADIECDETIHWLAGVAGRNTLVALTRWENPTTPRMIGHVVGETFYSGSQDVWAFIGGDFVGCGDGIPLGYVGCDQAILGEVMARGASIVNPCLSIHTWHRHAKPSEHARGSIAGLYAYPEPTTLATTGRLIWHKWPQP